MLNCHKYDALHSTMPGGLYKGSMVHSQTLTTHNQWHYSIQNIEQFNQSKFGAESTHNYRLQEII